MKNDPIVDLEKKLALVERLRDELHEDFIAVCHELGSARAELKAFYAAEEKTAVLNPGVLA